MHFFNRQYWHRFLFILKIEHCWFLVQGLYWIFCCMERRKKPWGLQLQLESRSGSELSSLEQPESLDSRRASSMLTSTECRSRSSAPQAIPSTIHYRAIHSLATAPRVCLTNNSIVSHVNAPRAIICYCCAAPTRLMVDSGLCGRCGVRRTVTRATYLPAADPPEKVRVPQPPRTTSARSRS